MEGESIFLREEHETEDRDIFIHFKASFHLQLSSTGVSWY